MPTVPPAPRTSAVFKSRSGELRQILGHRPAEGDQRVAPLDVDGVEEADHLLVDRLGLEALVVEHARRVAVAPGHEVAVVVAGVDAEALGQAAPPRPLLARGLVARAGDDVLEGAEGLEPGGVAEA